MEATNLADLYQSPPLDWSRIETQLDAGLGPGRDRPITRWLATVNPDGSPHVAGIGALWADACFWITTGKRPGGATRWRF